MLRARAFFPMLVVLAALAAACGGGGGGGGGVVPSPTATPHAGPTSVPVGPTPQAINLSGDGYTLSFYLPPVATGNTSTMSAVLQTALPSGTKAPQTAKHGYTPPRPLATTFTGLVYLVISTVDSVGFSYAPAFQYTLPSGTTIPSGSNAYLLYWDPYRSGSTGWIPLLGPGLVSGQTVSFPSVQTGVQFASDTPYVFALAQTTQTVPTATPAPTPTPIVGPSSPPASLPAYCANYTPSTAAGSQPVYITNNSDTGPQVQVYLYVTAGSSQYLGADGNMHTFTVGATAPAFPLECFPGSMNGGTGKTFALPVVQAGRMYIALATPQPGDTAPSNPLSFVGNSKTGGFTQPIADWNSASYVATPWDFVEFSLPGGITDVSQVDQVGLPLDVKQGTDEIGFGSGQYENLLSQIQAAGQPYSNLAISTNLAGKSILDRILAPNSATDWGFPQDWFYNSNFNTGYSSPAGHGYVGYVLSQYRAQPQPYEVSTIIGDPLIMSNQAYCASSDSTNTNVLFYNVGATAPPSCPTTFTQAPTYTMPIYNTLEGTGQNVSGAVCESGILSMPYGSAAGSSGALSDQYEFYLWKAMVIDLARGVALQTTEGPHPVGGWTTSTPPPLPFSDYYKDPVLNTYAKLVHDNMIGNNTYALQYDEPGGFAPTFSANSQPLQVTIRHIPAYTMPAPTPSATATPLACPTP